MRSQPKQPNTDPKHVPSLGQAARTAVREGVTLLQLNVEGLTKAKINILEHLVSTHKVTTILLQYKPHIAALRSKISARNNLLRCLVGSSWGASTFRTAALAIVHSAAEYAAPVWCRSVHAKKLDTTLNETLRIITGCLRSTPVAFMPVLAGIAPPKHRRAQATHKIACQAMDSINHPLHATLGGQPHGGRQRLVSRRPFSRHAAALVAAGFNINTAWCDDWKEVSRPLPPQFNVEPSTTTPTGADLPRKAWTTLNRLRTGVGRFGKCMHRWGLKTSSSCICGAESQTAEHILFDCRVLHPPMGQDDLKSPDEEGKRWLQLVAEYA
ncbi:uncharacterized protein LOC143463411 [Clavelina lepadiformis]|uniref:uncharacterized protein LOC143463411 n=1 Tax=Clavelina lepadiformis TaxID=159417 RepID=UPI004040F572